MNDQVIPCIDFFIEHSASCMLRSASFMVKDRFSTSELEEIAQKHKISIVIKQDNAIARYLTVSIDAQKMPGGNYNGKMVPVIVETGQFGFYLQNAMDDSAVYEVHGTRVS